MWSLWGLNKNWEGAGIEPALISSRSWKLRCFVLMEKLPDGRHFAFTISLGCLKPTTELELLHLMMHWFACSLTPGSLLFSAGHCVGHQDPLEGNHTLPWELQAGEEVSNRKFRLCVKKSEAENARHLRRGCVAPRWVCRRCLLTLPGLYLLTQKSVPKVVALHFQVKKKILLIKGRGS